MDAIVICQEYGEWWHGCRTLDPLRNRFPFGIASLLESDSYRTGNHHQSADDRWSSDDYLFRPEPPDYSADDWFQ